MKAKTLTNIENKSGSAAAKKTYSEEELAEVFMTSQDEFMGIDLEKATLNWNLNFIFTFLYLIGDLEQIDWVIDWMTTMWDEKHHIYDSFDNIYDSNLREESRKFGEQLRYVKSAVKLRLENEKRKNALIAKMPKGYVGSKSMTRNHNEPAAIETTRTKPPQFKHQPNETLNNGKPALRVSISDLPYNLQKNILVSQDVFDILVKQLNEDTWTIIDEHKTKYCDPLRFLCNYHSITSRNTTREEFDELLHHVVIDLKDKGSLTSSMSRYKPTNDKRIKRSYLCYANADVNKNMRDEIWPLYDDCQPLEESLKPVFDAMEIEKKKVSQSASQDAQASAKL